MRRCFIAVMALAAIAAMLLKPSAGFAAVSQPAGDAKVDPAPCFSAASAAEANPDQIIAACSPVVDNDKTAAADRLKAALARAGAYLRQDQGDRAIADYDIALKIDPAMADIFNVRGELWRKKGDRPRALADFGAAIRLNPQHTAARANYKSLAYELERIGAQIAVNNRPSFNCANAKQAVQKAICASPELANLDREIDVASTLAINAAGAGTSRGREMRHQQEAFLTARNAAFGRPGYDLQMAMKDRLQQLRGRAP
jgi:tetratricopeptide (TPR) repeat protein